MALDLKTYTDGHCVSTVKLPTLGIFDSDYAYETMIFVTDGEAIISWSEVYCARYATAAEAKKGHVDAIAKLRSGEVYRDV